MLLAFALPLIAAVSLVYAASRHERFADIWSDALRFGLMVTGFLILVSLLLWPLTANL